MGALPKSKLRPMLTGVAEVSVIGGRQVVFLPENMHVDVSRLDVIQHGANLQMSPARKLMTEAEFAQWVAKLDTYQRELGDFMPDGREQPPMPDGDDIEL